MAKHILHITEIPGLEPAVGSYSLATVLPLARIAFFSGRVAPPVENGTERPSLGEQTRIIMRDFGAALGHVGLSFADLAKANISIRDVTESKFSEVNGAYAASINEAEPELEGYPARATLGANPPLDGSDVEIELTAALPDGWTPSVIGATASHDQPIKLVGYSDVMPR